MRIYETIARHVLSRWWWECAEGTVAAMVKGIALRMRCGGDADDCDKMEKLLLTHRPSIKLLSPAVSCLRILIHIYVLLVSTSRRTTRHYAVHSIVENVYNFNQFEFRSSGPKLLCPFEYVEMAEIKTHRLALHSFVGGKLYPKTIWRNEFIPTVVAFSTIFILWLLKRCVCSILVRLSHPPDMQHRTRKMNKNSTETIFYYFANY